MHYDVRISPTAMTTILIAAIEGYRFGNPRATKDTFVEINGYVWGHRRHVDDRCHMHVVQFSPSVTAEQDKDSVEFAPGKATAMDEVIQDLTPHLALMGHLHTHPYRKVTDARRSLGWQMSPGDLDVKGNETEDLEAMGGDETLWMLLALAKYRRSGSHERKIVHLKTNIEPNTSVVEFNHCGMKFWLTAGVAGWAPNGELEFRHPTTLALT